MDELLMTADPIPANDLPPEEDRGDLAVMLTGGGARAAYQAGLLRGIAKHFPNLQFDIVTGVSAGALNAIVLAGTTGSLQRKVEALSRIWSKLEGKHVFRMEYTTVARKMMRGAAGVFGVQIGQRMKGLVNTEPLRDLLTAALACSPGDAIEGIRTNIANGSLKALALVTLDYSTGQTVRWVQGRDINPWTGANRRSITTDLTVNHAMASAALPIIFPAIRLGEHYHGDGGIRLSAPLSPALHLGARRILAMSTAYQRSDVEANVPTVDGYPPSVQILGQLLNAIFLDAIEEDVARMERINAMIHKLPPEQRDGFRAVDLFVLRPGRDLGVLAGAYEKYLPRSIRYLTRGIGTQETDAPDFLSMLMFEPHYLSRLIEIGEEDVEMRIEEIATFLDGVKRVNIQAVP
jgi:NTE family protein